MDDIHDSLIGCCLSVSLVLKTPGSAISLKADNFNVFSMKTAIKIFVVKVTSQFWTDNKFYWVRINLN